MCRGLLLSLAGFTMAQAPLAPGTSTRAVVAAAAAYVAEYQEQLTYVLADETYFQQVAIQSPRDPNMPRMRTMRSETFFLFAPGGGWMAIRDVLETDGNPVRERPDVRGALQALPPRQVAAKFKDYNSRFNIGRTYRNFNEPTLSLLVLDEDHRERFAFDRRRVVRDGDAVLVTLGFRERETPTLITDPHRGRVFSRGELIVEAGTGQIRRAVLTASIQNLSLQLTTQYSLDERLGIWVPTSFREEYEYGAAASNPYADQQPEHERIVCEATYSNYRRFETTARIR
jgi:hypothetical protein